MTKLLEALQRIDATAKREHYEKLLPGIRQIARQFGYAIGLHGTMERDLDLIAVPWVEKCSPPDELAKVIQIGVCGHWGDWVKEEKPHGRIGYVLRIGTYAYIDLSVMPLRECTEPVKK